jgi:two-component system NarL family response regulator
VLDIGARGYLLKTCDADELVRAIDAVRRGRLFVTDELTHVLVDRMNDPAGGQGGGGGGEDGKGGPRHADMLTPREREVVQLIAEGHTSKDIAERLSTAVKTIESHRTNAMGKLGLHSIAALTKFALREGLTQLAD